MMNNTSLLRNDERAVLALRELYHTHGYTPYKMNKFEEYDLYVRNKSFLVSDHVITFTDTNGKLMAMKPDVTLSIIKNGKDGDALQKVYYHENVYRVSGRTGDFREIMQAGLECIGDVDGFAVFEVLTLAAKSLLKISPDCVLDISHLGILTAVLDTLSVTGATREQLIRCIGEKNTHELGAICLGAGVAPERTALLQTLVSSYGKPSTVLPALEGLLAGTVDAALLREFSALIHALERTECGDIVRIDFSVVSDMGYYNGIVFKGFVSGVPSDILSGGQYDGLMRKMGRSAGAIGFAVYLDRLERLSEQERSYDVDVALLYGEDADPAALYRAAGNLIAQGKTVTVLRELPEKLRYHTLMKFDEKEGRLCE